MNTIKPQIHKLTERYPVLSSCVDDIMAAYDVLLATYSSGHKLLVAGNGGSAADSEHIAGELMKRFMLPRPVDSAFAQKLIAVDEERGRRLAQNLDRSLTAIPLVAHEALTTAYINDADGHGVFAQQLLGFGAEGDVFLAISTSGNSENIINAAIVAKAMNIRTIALTGADGGRLKELSDITVRVPETETYRIQELHLPVYHTWCMMLEEHFFSQG